MTVSVPFILAAGAGTVLTAGWAPLLGALHALEPGHGKSLVAAYLVGARGRIADAVVLGITVAITHTAAAIALGLGVGLFGQAFRGDAARQALQIVSASLVLIIGAWMFRTLSRAGRHHAHHHHHHDHDHGRDHPHEAPRQRKPIFGAGGVIGLGVSGGLIPCPAALAVVVSVLGRTTAWMALGTVLLFSAGMGVALTTIAVAVVKFGRFFERRASARWVQYLPIVSAAVVTLMGAVLLVLAIWWPGALGGEGGGHG
ncbi:MAG: hypothetical protein BIFFINMI_03868 [Phycisphaerae bacterium]|nr:hypothetical protein [Phycisphaerae bacterium]